MGHLLLSGLSLPNQKKKKKTKPIDTKRSTTNADRGKGGEDALALPDHETIGPISLDVLSLNTSNLRTIRFLDDQSCTAKMRTESRNLWSANSNAKVKASAAVRLHKCWQRVMGFVQCSKGSFFVNVTRYISAARIHSDVVLSDPSTQSNSSALTTILFAWSKKGWMRGGRNQENEQTGTLANENS